MEPCPSDISDDLQSLSFNSTVTTTTTTTTTTDVNRSSSTSSAAFSTTTTTTTTTHISFSDLRFISRLGAGDIGSVYLTQLLADKSPQNTPLLAAKVMDKKELAARNKEGRARTEREILEMLEHPFLPSLHAVVDSPKWTCLLTEFCPGGDLHVLRQRQPCRRFDESAVRFYASEVVVAVEYLHMLGIVYRDLKPENVLVRSDGHIMLTDFDLSLRCDESSSTPAQIITGRNGQNPDPGIEYRVDPLSKFASTSCIIPNCMVPAVSCFTPKRRRKKKPARHVGPEFVAEPVDVRSMSFVGTHEYLAPEIVSGEGHGSAVDWWTLGVFIFELFYGVTPFRGMDHEVTLANIVARALEFPKEPAVSPAARDLIAQLLAKEPTRRLGSTMGASAVKHHPFFQGVNWALLRCASPPYIPPRFNLEDLSDESFEDTPIECY